MTESTGFSEIIALWKDCEEIAVDLGVKGTAVRKWKARDRIPAEYWQHIVSAAERRGFQSVTLARLAEISARRNHAPSVGADEAA